MSNIKCCTQFGTVSEADVNTLISEMFSGNGTMFCTYTDRIVCIVKAAVDDLEHLLEIRLFSENAELKISRPIMGEEFRWRLIDDDKFREELCSDDDEYDGSFELRTFDEEQYLDIDSVRSDAAAGRYTATGGGKYTLPAANAEKILIRNYIDYDIQGIAAFCDFRIVKFL